MSEFYSQEKSSKKRGNYIYYNPECKDCTERKAEEWRQRPENRRKWLEINKKANKKPQKKKQMDELRKGYRENGRYKQWLNSDSGKASIKKSQEKRKEKEHKITIEERDSCRLYFDYRCAYCGKTYEQNYKETNKDLHKEHVIHDGRNDLKNCVPACNSCNSSKGEYTLNYWYRKQEFYSRERYLKIYQWLRFDAKSYIQKIKVINN